MSTKAIRRLIERAKQGAAPTHADCQQALVEVEAIEKAGRYGYLMMTGDIHMAKKDEEKAADKVFSNIYNNTGRSEG